MSETIKVDTPGKDDMPSWTKQYPEYQNILYKMYIESVADRVEIGRCQTQPEMRKYLIQRVEKLYNR
jgi:hypothetical protein